MKGNALDPKTSLSSRSFMRRRVQDDTKWNPSKLPHELRITDYVFFKVCQT